MFELNAKKISGLIRGGAIVYLALLIAVVGFAALTYSELYTTPTQQARMQTPQDTPMHPGYHRYVTVTGVALSILLVLWSAAVGVLRRKPLHGFIALAIASAVTGAGFAVMPWLYFSNDQYGVTAAWVMGMGLPILAGWALLTFLAWFIMRPRTEHVSETA